MIAPGPRSDESSRTAQSPDTRRASSNGHGGHQPMDKPELTGDLRTG
jgi:hypothetical protein